MKKVVCKKCQYSNSNLLSFNVSHLGHTTTGLINTFFSDCTHFTHSNQYFQAKITIYMISKRFKIFAQIEFVMSITENSNLKIANRRTSWCLLYVLYAICVMVDMSHDQYFVHLTQWKNHEYTQFSFIHSSILNGTFLCDGMN